MEAEQPVALSQESMTQGGNDDTETEKDLVESIDKMVCPC